MNTFIKNNHTRMNLLLLLASCVCLIFFLLQLLGFYHDDAYISLRYANNFLAGNGLVWNIGETVEGYTCFLWVILISVLGAFHVDLVIASKFLGIVFAFATLIIFFIFERQKMALGALLLSTNSYFALWAVGGLETIAFGFFVFLACYLFQKNHRNWKTLIAIGFIFALATMTRPEGIIFFTITILFCFFNEGKISNSNLKSVFSLLTGFLVLYSPYFIWRFYYYGHLFPCTFYVKGGTNIFKILFGIRYGYHFLISCGFLVVVMFFIKDWKKFVQEKFYLICSIIFYCGYILLIGGDHMEGFRFFVPILSLFYLLIQESLAETRFNSRLFVLCLSLIVVSINLFNSYRSIPKRYVDTMDAQSHSDKYRKCFTVPDQAAYIGKLVGLYIKAHWPAHATVAANTAGSTPYFSNMKFIDMLGLNDYTIAKSDTPSDDMSFFRDFVEVKKIFTGDGRREIIQYLTKRYLTWQLMPGHGKGDGPYVLARKPEYIIIGPAHGDTKPWFLSDKEIIAATDFYKNYELKEATIKISDTLHRYYQPTKTGNLTFRYYERQ
jgi:arabinofuranosyltransferase